MPGGCLIITRSLQSITNSNFNGDLLGFLVFLLCLTYETFLKETVTKMRKVSWNLGSD